MCMVNHALLGVVRIFVFLKVIAHKMSSHRLLR
jgi:hypothetical protein